MESWVLFTKNQTKKNKMRDEKKNKKYFDIIRVLLSQVLGTDYTDIQAEDSFIEDLHMGPAEIADFIQLMNEKDFNIDENIFNEEVETVGELIEYLVDNE